MADETGASANPPSFNLIGQYIRDMSFENPGAPAIAKPVNTTLPVMLATKTRPNCRMLTASTKPVTTVSTSKSGGSGP